MAKSNKISGNTGVKLSPKIVFIILILGFCWSLTYALSFIQFILYDPFKEALGATNAELGILIAIFGIGNIVGAPIGGWLADKFDYKKIFVASMMLTGVISLFFAFNLNYGMALVCWGGLAVSSLFMNYPSHTKIVRMLVNEESQGKAFGFNEAFIGVASVVTNFIFMGVFASYAEQVAGIQMVIILMGIFTIIAGILAWIFVPNVDKDEKLDGAKASETGGKDFIKVLLSPGVWLLGLSIFCVYTLYVTLSYFTPYFSAVFGVSASVTGFIAVVRTYFLRLAGAPFGGWLADKIKSSSKVLLIVYAAGAIALISMLILPQNPPIFLVVAITLILGFSLYMGRGVYYAVSSEVDIPRRYAAMAFGIAGALGFSPDLFQYTMYGDWLDKYGNGGYTYMFIFQLVVVVVGIATSTYVVMRKKRLDAQKQPEEGKAE